MNAVISRGKIRHLYFVWCQSARQVGMQSGRMEFFRHTKSRTYFEVAFEARGHLKRKPCESSQGHMELARNITHACPKSLMTMITRISCGSRIDRLFFSEKSLRQLMRQSTGHIRIIADFRSSKYTKAFTRLNWVIITNFKWLITFTLYKSVG